MTLVHLLNQLAGVLGAITALVLIYLLFTKAPKLIGFLFKQLKNLVLRIKSKHAEH